jgi:hypothetical protein
MLSLQLEMKMFGHCHYAKVITKIAWFKSKLVKILIALSGLCVKGITTAEV